MAGDLPHLRNAPLLAKIKLRTALEPTARSPAHRPCHRCAKLRLPQRWSLVVTAYGHISSSRCIHVLHRHCWCHAARRQMGRIGILGYSPGCRILDITDGTSSTVLAGERPPPDSLQAGWWYPIYNYYCQTIRGPNNGMSLPGGKACLEDDGCSVSVSLGPGRADNRCDRFHFWSFHPGGANFGFADSSVHFLPYSAEPLMIALGSINGGEVVELP